MALPILSLLTGGMVAGTGVVITAIIAKVLFLLGIGALTFTGIDILLDQLRDLVDQQLGQVTGYPEALAILNLLQLDNAINLIFSAAAAKFALKGIQAGVMKTLKFSP